MSNDPDLNPLRYNITVDKTGTLDVVLSEDAGEWVDAGDFDALADKYKHLQQRYDALMATIERQ